MAKANDNPIINGADFAFVAVTTDTGTNTIGVATKGKRGYSSIFNLTYTTYADAQIEADRLNSTLGLTTLEAWKIVASTMRTN